MVSQRKIKRIIDYGMMVMLPDASQLLFAFGLEVAYQQAVAIF